jgi:hypothetical protein
MVITSLNTNKNDEKKKHDVKERINENVMQCNRNIIFRIILFWNEIPYNNYGWEWALAQIIIPLNIPCINDHCFVMQIAWLPKYYFHISNIQIKHCWHHDKWYMYMWLEMQPRSESKMSDPKYPFLESKPRNRVTEQSC